MADLPVVNRLDDLNKTSTEIRDGQVDSAQIFKSNMKALSSSNLSIKAGLDSLNLTLNKMFNLDAEHLKTLEEQLRLAEENRREDDRGKELKSGTADAKKSDSKFDFNPLLLSAYTAFAASLFGFDAYLKALGLPKTIDRFKTTFNAFKSGIDKIKLPKVTISNTAVMDNIAKQVKFAAYAAIGLGQDGKPIAVRGADGKFQQGLYTRITNSANEIVKAFTTGLDSIKTSILAGGEGGGLFTRISTAFTTLIDEVKKPFLLFTADNPFTKGLSDVKKSISAFFDALPRFSIGSADSVFSFARVLGSAKEGTGILGFFGKAFGLLDPIIKPLKSVLGVVLRPFTQFLLTFIDFVTGFYEGFTSAEGGLMDKLLAGIEGGIKGVIKGITDAIDLIFVKLPAWIMEKLGFEDTAASLSDFSFTALVDPIWDGIKGFFKKLFTGDFMGALSDIGDLYKTLYGFILRQVLPKPDPNAKWYDIGNLVSKVIPASVYEFAGLDPETGERVPEPPDLVQPDDVGEVVTPSESATGSGGLAGSEIQTRSENVETAKQSNPTISPVVSPVSVDASSQSSVQQVNAFGGTNAQRQKQNPVMGDFAFSA
jgi:hypothetical protein